MDSRLSQLDAGNFSLGSHQTGLRTLHFCSPHIVDSAINHRYVRDCLSSKIVPLIIILTIRMNVEKRDISLFHPSSVEMRV